jgi:hypothetical protein
VCLEYGHEVSIMRSGPLGAAAMWGEEFYETMEIIVFNYFHIQNVITYSMLIFEVPSEHVKIQQEIHANLSRAGKWSCLLTWNKLK